MPCRAAIIYRMRIRALSKCEPLTKAFAECTEARLLSIVWACRPQLNALNECTKQQCVPLRSSRPWTGQSLECAARAVSGL